MTDSDGLADDAWRDAHLDTPRSAAIAAFASPGRVALTRATRALVDAALTAEECSEATLLATAQAIEHQAALLAGMAPTEHEPGVRERAEHAYADYLPRSPAIGEIHPFAPPLEPRWDSEARVLIASGRLTAAYEGPPGYAHGGILAMLFDELLGMANIAAGCPGMTASLTVDYRRPTPIHVPLEFRAWNEPAAGRRIRARGTCTVEGVVTAEAHGSFATVSLERAVEYFGERRAPFAEPD